MSSAHKNIKGKKEESAVPVQVTAVKKGSGHGEAKPQVAVAPKHHVEDDTPPVVVAKKEKFDAQKSLQGLLADQDKKSRAKAEREQHHKHIADAKKLHEAELKAHRKEEHEGEKVKADGATAGVSPAHVEVFHSV